MMGGSPHFSFPCAPGGQSRWTAHSPASLLGPSACCACVAPLRRNLSRAVRAAPARPRTHPHHARRRPQAWVGAPRTSTPWCCRAWRRSRRARCPWRWGSTSPSPRRWVKGLQTSIPWAPAPWVSAWFAAPENWGNAGQCRREEGWSGLKSRGGEGPGGLRADSAGAAAAAASWAAAAPGAPLSCARCQLAAGRCTQRDAEHADIEKERREQMKGPEAQVGGRFGAASQRAWGWVAEPRLRIASSSP